MPVACVTVCCACLGFSLEVDPAKFRELHTLRVSYHDKLGTMVSDRLAVGEKLLALADEEPSPERTKKSKILQAELDRLNRVQVELNARAETLRRFCYLRLKPQPPKR